MVNRINLTDRWLKAKRAPGDYWAEYPRGFGVRVSAKGTKTFTLTLRAPGSKHPTRRALGQYGVLTLEQARKKAEQWKNLVKAGIDPTEHERREKEKRERQAIRDRELSFGAAAGDYIYYIHREGLRTASILESELRSKFVKEWAARPIAEITTDDVRRVVGAAVKRGAKYQAYKDLALIRRLFNWAIGTGAYGIDRNPCDRLVARDFIGSKAPRSRVLSDDEIRALWRASERIGYPYGPLYRLLLLTGLRLNSACGANRQEFDLERREWEIPSSRMKSLRGHGARPFLVPLTDAMIDIIEALPDFGPTSFLFSHNGGKAPLRVDQFSGPKARLDGLMLEELRKIAAERGADPERVNLPPWRNHDVRRTVRTRLSALRISEEAREAVMAHVRPGILRVYDLHDYAEEKREALTLWAARLREILEPPPQNVVPLERRAR